jgi:hypothetical protein
MVPQLGIIQSVEGGVRNTPVLRGPVDAEVAFTAVQPP